MKEYIELIISMSTDLLLDKITLKTYLSNLKMIIDALEEYNNE